MGEGRGGRKKGGGRRGRGREEGEGGGEGGRRGREKGEGEGEGGREEGEGGGGGGKGNNNSYPQHLINCQTSCMYRLSLLFSMSYCHFGNIIFDDFHFRVVSTRNCAGATQDLVELDEMVVPKAHVSSPQHCPIFDNI